MDQERDHAEELDNAMIPFQENMRLVFNSGWDYVDLGYWVYCGESNNKKYNRREGIMKGTGENITVEENQGWISISLGLKEAPDGSLWEEIDD